MVPGLRLPEGSGGRPEARRHPAPGARRRRQRAGGRPPDQPRRRPARRRPRDRGDALARCQRSTLGRKVCARMATTPAKICGFRRRSARRRRARAPTTSGWSSLSRRQPAPRSTLDEAARLRAARCRRRPRSCCSLVNRAAECRPRRRSTRCGPTWSSSTAAKRPSGWRCSGRACRSRSGRRSACAMPPTLERAARYRGAADRCSTMRRRQGAARRQRAGARLVAAGRLPPRAAVGPGRRADARQRRRGDPRRPARRWSTPRPGVESAPGVKDRRSRILQGARAFCQAARDGDAT